MWKTNSANFLRLQEKIFLVTPQITDIWNFVERNLWCLLPVERFAPAFFQLLNATLIQAQVQMMDSWCSTLDVLVNNYIISASDVQQNVQEKLIKKLAVEQHS